MKRSENDNDEEAAASAAFLLEKDDDPVPAEVAALHERCGVYTRPEAVRWFLDRVGWTEDADLADARLLEPAAGDGAFLVEAARRLVRSRRQRGLAVTASDLAPHIVAFELHEGEAERATVKIADTLRSEGLKSRSANAAAQRWLAAKDFLLADLRARSFTHVVGNPPYVRWSRIPPGLRKAYRSVLPARAARGDLSLSFLEKSLELLADGGHLGFLCSDRWFYAAYAEAFRTEVLPSYVIERREKVDEAEVFERRVDAYPVKLIMRRRRHNRRVATQAMSGNDRISARRTYERWRSLHPSLEEAGCTVRVGPALGCTPAFVGRPGEMDVEDELLAPYTSPAELNADRLDWSGRHVVCMHSAQGPIDPNDFPRLKRHLDEHREALSRRAFVVAGAPWYRTIDRVERGVWSKPKILIPEMSRSQRIVVDRSGVIPSHGIYAIFSSEWPIETLANVLRADVLWTTLQSISPERKGGHLRAYARFLNQIHLPKWKDIPTQVQAILRNGSGSQDNVTALMDHNVRSC